jgi:hypothetical protein
MELNAVPKVTELEVTPASVIVPLRVGRSGCARVRNAGVEVPPVAAPPRNVFAATALVVMATAIVPAVVTGELVTAAVKKLGTVTVTPTDVT